MALDAPLFAAAVGVVCGILSGFGIGGGSILMVWLTAILSTNQISAQGINLLFFLPTALTALSVHIREKRIRWNAVLPAAAAGTVTAALSAWAAADMNLSVLKRLFGGFLLVIGIMELMKKPTQN